MLLAELKKVLRPEERVVLYDRFQRVIEQEKPCDITEYLLQVEVSDMYYSALYGCIAIKLKVGKFE